jgi:seryl-tRNA synthetase
VGLVLGGLAAMFVLAGRGYHEWTGFVRASADQAVDGVTEALPEEIHDKKLDNELGQVKADLIDRQVAMNLSKRQREELQSEITSLEGRTERRKRLLAEAYPVLKAAIDGQQATVKWANQPFALADFQNEIDDLLVLQDRETRQLEIKRAGLPVCSTARPKGRRPWPR